MTAKTDANTASNPYYTLTVTPGKNYRWETPEKDSYRYDYELKWKILPQQVSIEVVGEREAERRDSTWHPEIATDYRFTTIFEDTLAIGLHHGTATLINHNYEWVVSTETDTDGNPYDYVDSGDFLVMYIGYKITETRYNITFTQNDWNYGDEPGYFTAEPDNNDQRIKDMLASDDGYRIVYQRMLEDGTYSQNIYNVPTEAGKYHAAIIVDAIEGFYASIQSNWDEFEIIAATIARINPNPSGDTFYNGDAYDILNIIDEQATTVNSQEDVWWFSLEQNASKEDFSKELLLTNAGTYTVWYYVSAPNHNDSEIASFHIKISPKPVTIEIGQSQVNEDGSIVQNAMYYNGEIPSISDLDIMYSLAEGSSLGTGDTLEDLGFELNLDDIKKDVDTYTVTGFDNDSEDNYVVTVNSGTFEILKIDLVVNAEGFTKTYDNIEYGFSSNISGLVFTTQHDDTVTWSFRVGDSGEYDDTGVTDAGTYTVYLHGESHNYNIIATEYVTVEIEQKTLTATVQDSEVEYGRGVGEFGISYQGFANGHSEENLSLNPSFIHIYEPGYNAYDTNLNVGATITGNETFSKNYQCNVVEGELDVIPRKVTAIIGNESITYGDPSATLESTCGDMYGNDSINSYVILSIDGYDDSMPDNFGTYRIIGQDRDNNDNYEVSFVGEGTQNTFGTYTITALSVTIHLVTPESLT